MNDSDKYLQFGIPGMDKILRGGLPANQMYAVYGSSGSGKTTFGFQFLLQGVKEKERSLYIGTAETGSEIRRVSESHGWDLSGIKLEHLSIHLGEKSGPGQTMLYPAEIELPQIVDSLIEKIQKYNPQRVVIDSLSEIRLLARQRSWYQRQLMMLKQFLESRACTTLLTDTLGEENGILQTIVHGAIEMQRSNPVYGPERRRLRIEKLRGLSFISGYHDYIIHKGGVKVFPRLISAEHLKEFPREPVSSGIDELDNLLGGGFDRGTCALLQGAAGTGKSALASQFAVAAANRNERCAIFCFDERIATFIKRAKSLGVDMESYMADGRIIVNQIDPAEVSAGEFSSEVAELVRDKGVSLVVIDSLNGYAYALPDERFLSVHLHELASFLNLQGVVSIFTMAQRVGFGLEATSLPFEISYISDSVLNLGYFEYSGTVHKALSVLKRRSGKHERTIRELIMDDRGLHVGPVLHDFEGLVSGVPRYVGSETKLGKGDDVNG